MKRLIVLAMVLAFCMGCGGLAGEPVNGWNAMQETVTTKQDILARYGKPTRVWEYTTGDVVWIYDLGQTREARLVFIGDLLSEKLLFYRGSPVAHIGGLVDW